MNTCSITLKVLSFSLFLILVGCADNRAKQPVTSVVPPPQSAPPVVTPAKPMPPVIPEPVPGPPAVPSATAVTPEVTKPHRSAPPVKTHHYNWDAAMKSLLAGLKKQGVDMTHGTLQVSHFSNRASGDIDAERGHAFMVSALNSHTQFSVLTAEKMQTARQSLGISGNDALQTRGKALAVSRTLNADYMLYSTIRGKVSQPVMSVSIIGVSDGMLLFSSKIPLKEIPQKV